MQGILSVPGKDFTPEINKVKINNMLNQLHIASNSLNIDAWSYSFQNDNDIDLLATGFDNYPSVGSALSIPSGETMPDSVGIHSFGVPISSNTGSGQRNAIHTMIVGKKAALCQFPSATSVGLHYAGYDFGKFRKEKVKKIVFKNYILDYVCLIVNVEYFNDEGEWVALQSFNVPEAQTEYTLSIESDIYARQWRISNGSTNVNGWWFQGLQFLDENDDDIVFKYLEISGDNVSSAYLATNVASFSNMRFYSTIVGDATINNTSIIYRFKDRPRHIRRIIYKTYAIVNNSTAYSIYYSDDGSTWTLLQNFTGLADVAYQTVMLNLNASGAHEYWKMVPTVRPGGTTDGWSLYHISMYEGPPNSISVRFLPETSSEVLDKLCVVMDATLGTGSITWYVSDNGTTWEEITDIAVMQDVNFITTTIYLKCVITGDASVNTVVYGG